MAKQECKGGFKIHRCNLLYQQTTNENHMVISTDAEKQSNKVQYPLMITISKLKNKGHFFSLMKAYTRTLANITLNGGRLHALPLNHEKKNCPLLPFLFNIISRGIMLNRNSSQGNKTGEKKHTD